MPKKKKDKQKRRQREASNGSWSMNDFEIDRWGRFVPTHPILARRLIEAISRDGGLVLHITPEMSNKIVTDLPNLRCPIPLFGCPNPNKLECPDIMCGDRMLMRVPNPARDLPDPPPDAGGRPPMVNPQ